MSQVLIPAPIEPSIRTTTTTSSVATAISTVEIFLAVMDMVMSKPVKIVDNKLRVNENIMEENRIYSVTHKDQEYFVRRKKGVTEIFQLSDSCLISSRGFSS